MYVYDWERDAMTKLSSTRGINNRPVWTPDGKGIVNLSQPGDGYEFYWVRSDGASAPVRLTQSKNLQAPYSFSPDGKRLAYTENGGDTGGDLWILPIDWSDPEHPKAGRPEEFLRTPEPETDPAFSPDGHWIAYASGRGPNREIYVRPYPPNPSAGRVLVSSGGGSFPVWPRKGSELFYQTFDNRVMAVSYRMERSSFVADKPRLWTGQRMVESPTSPILLRNYDITPDGKRLLVLQVQGAADDRPTGQANIVLNFFDELRRRVPVK
jgi:dipeptidyl aminopeptidase/acylaminoacyl peptidase